MAYRRSFFAPPTAWALKLFPGRSYARRRSPLPPSEAEYRECPLRQKSATLPKLKAQVFFGTPEYHLPKLFLKGKKRELSVNVFLFFGESMNIFGRFFELFVNNCFHF